MTGWKAVPQELTGCGAPDPRSLDLSFHSAEEFDSDIRLYRSSPDSQNLGRITLLSSQCNGLKNDPTENTSTSIITGSSML